MNIRFHPFRTFCREPSILSRRDLCGVAHPLPQLQRRPAINIRAVTVIWQYYGLSPEEMEQRVTTYSEYFISNNVDDVIRARRTKRREVSRRRFSRTSACAAYNPKRSHFLPCRTTLITARGHNPWKRIALGEVIGMAISKEVPCRRRDANCCPMAVPRATPRPLQPRNINTLSSGSWKWGQ